MHTLIHRVALASGLIAAVLTAAPLWAEDTEHGRISYATDDALIYGVDEDDWSFAGINTLVLEGDRIWADNSGAIELEFAQGNFVRLADGSELEVVDLPPDGIVRGWVGSFYVQRLDNSRGDLIFDTGAAQLDFDDDSIARVDVLTDGSTTLSVLEGRVAIYTEFGRVMDVGRNQRTYVDPGLLPSEPERIWGDEGDTFDAWNRTRTERLRGFERHETFRQSSTRPLGVRDLDDYGEWVYVDRSYYWRPIHVQGFVPYRHGRWSYARHHGHVWVGAYPFSYTTSHYGYWHHDRRYGWLWSYEPVYAPARVASVYYGDVLFWAPIDRYGYTVYGTHFDFSIGGFHFSLAYSSYAYADYVFGHHHHHHSYYHYPYSYYYAQPLHRHVINTRSGNQRAQLWNYADNSRSSDWDSTRRNSRLDTWNGDRRSNVRGATRTEGRGRASDVVAGLRRNSGRTEFRTARVTSGSDHTSATADRRSARTRTAAVNDRGLRIESTESTRQRSTTERTPRSTTTYRSGNDSSVRVTTATPRESRGTRSITIGESRGSTRSYVSRSDSQSSRTRSSDSIDRTSDRTRSNNTDIRASGDRDRRESVNSTERLDPSRTRSNSTLGSDSRNRDSGSSSTTYRTRTRTNTSPAPSITRSPTTTREPSASSGSRTPSTTRSYTRSTTPTDRSYTPPSRSESRSTRSYTPPTRSYTPPTRSYTPPTRSYTPPSRSSVSSAPSAPRSSSTFHGSSPSTRSSTGTSGRTTTR